MLQTLQAPSMLKRIWNSKLTRDVAVLSVGTALAQVIALAATPFVTRLYGPEAFGTLGTFTAFVGFLAPLAALSYPMAIVLPESDADAFGLVRLSLTIGALSSLVVGAVLVLFGNHLAASLRLEALQPFSGFIPFAMIASVAVAALNYWAIRKKLFALNAQITVAHSALLNGAKAGLGFLVPMPGVLIGATVGAWFAQAVLLLSGSGLRSAEWRAAPSRGWFASDLARRFRDFPLYRAPQIALNSASTGLPVLMMASFFGTQAAGYYALAALVLAAPLTLVGRSVGDALYPRINELALGKQAIFQVLLRATWLIAVVAILPFAVIVVAGPWLFTFIFGGDWQKAGVYASWIAAWLYFAIVNRPTVAAIPVLGAQHLLLWYEVASVFLRMGALWFGFAFFESDIWAVALFSLVGVIVNAALVAAVFSLARNHDALAGSR